jgi:iron(III) transport system ATP-binding protein
MSVALALTGVTKRFDKVVAVNGVDLEVADGEILALVGPSGCGKSTLLRLVAGIHEADEGSISVQGMVVDDGRKVVEPEHRRVGLVFQEHALFPHLTVAKNVGFGLRRKDERAARTDAMLELVGLADMRDRYPHELSGGERQRVALARALAPEPGVLLLDEPFASLDPNLRARLRRDIVAILRAAGTAVVFVTHDQGEALAVGDRVAVMRGGQLVQVAAATDVFHRPADMFVASFMGEADELVPADAARLGAASPNGHSQILLVRPDDLAIGPSDQGSATVTELEYRGAVWCCTIELAGGSQVRALYDGDEPPGVGTRVDVELRAGHTLLRVAAREAHFPQY